MKRLTLVLAVAGIALLVFALWRWQEASDDQQAADALCSFGGAQCAASMNWTSVVIPATFGAVALLAAWAISASRKGERAEDLVG